MQGLWQCEHCVNYPVRRVEVFFLCLFSIQGPHSLYLCSFATRLYSYPRLNTVVSQPFRVADTDSTWLPSCLVCKRLCSEEAAVLSIVCLETAVHRVGLLEGARGQWPSQRRSLRSERRYWIVGSSAVSSTSWLVILSFQVISRILQRNLKWSVFSLASCLVHV